MYSLSSLYLSLSLPLSLSPSLSLSLSPLSLSLSLSLPLSFPLTPTLSLYTCTDRLRITKSGNICSSIRVTLKGPYALVADVSDGQYCSHFFLLPSLRLVTMTMICGLSCHIRRQKSMSVFGNGPVLIEVH